MSQKAVMKPILVIGGVFLSGLFLYFIWTEVFLNRVILKREVRRLELKSGKRGTLYKYYFIFSLKSQAELVKDLVTLERRFIILILVILTVGASLLLFGAICHYDPAQGKFIETENSWRKGFFGGG